MNIIYWKREHPRVINLLFNCFSVLCERCIYVCEGGPSRTVGVGGVGHKKNKDSSPTLLAPSVYVCIYEDIEDIDTAMFCPKGCNNHHILRHFRSIRHQVGRHATLYLLILPLPSSMHPSPYVYELHLDHALFDISSYCNVTYVKYHQEAGCNFCKLVVSY